MKAGTMRHNHQATNYGESGNFVVKCDNDIAKRIAPHLRSAAYRTLNSAHRPSVPAHGEEYEPFVVLCGPQIPQDLM